MNLRLVLLLPLASLAVLTACSSTPMKPVAETQNGAFGPILETAHRGQDDLVSAGLGIEGLRSASAPEIADPNLPTSAELRRRAIWANWRGIADLRTGGGAGDSLPQVPGREFSAFATLAGAQQPQRVLVQLPDHFDPARPCVVVAPASGSRGVYGAIAVAAPWALPRGCAVAYTDKGAGSDYVDLASGDRTGLDGRLAHDAAAPAFSPRTEATTGIAFKHAHSQDNPEADWGRHVRQAAQFGLQVLERAFPEHGPFTAANTRVIAVGISNGGGAVLRAAEFEDDLFDAVVAGEPNIWADAPGARPLYDYATLAARLMPCALLAVDDWPVPPMPETLRALGTQRCATLAARAEVSGADVAAQARDARAQLEAAGFDQYALHSGVTTTGFDLWRAVAATYASAYGRFAAGAHPCGFAYALLDESGAPRSSTPSERALWWSDASGIPPGNGIALRDPNRIDADPDPDLAGLDCLRRLWTGHDAAAQRVQDGVAATRAKPPRAGLPVVIVHGRDDGLIPVAFSSAPYVAMAHAAGREVTFWQVPNAQHFDAFLALPDYGRRFVPLLPRVHAALDAVWAHLNDPGTPILERAPTP